MEQGYIWMEERDCIDQLTIIYSPYDKPPRRGAIRFDTSGAYHNKAHGQYFREQMIYWPRDKQLVLDTCYNIHDRPLYVMATREYDAEKQRYTYLLTGEALAWGREVEFEFKLISDRQDSISTHFIEDAAEIIQTVRFSSPFSFGR